MVYHDVEAELDWQHIKTGECPDCHHNLELVYISSDHTETAVYHCKKCGWDEAAWERDRHKREATAAKQLQRLGYVN